MTPTPQPAPQDLDAIWASARRLHPIYAELAREFVVEAPPCANLETAEEMPDPEAVEQAQQWLNDMDERIKVHQLRQFLQTSSLVDQEALIALLKHLLAKSPKSDSVRDKIDFLLVQFFSQAAPSELDDYDVDLAYVAQALEPVLGQVDLKTPVWLNALDRVLDAARRCSSLDALLHGGVLEQGRKAKIQAGDLFYLPVALLAFTRFGYLMRRVFFRLMLGDLNNILEGLDELDERGIETIDCRRAQFSAQEPVMRLRMICQSWKVMFQAEYSSGQPLRMLVDLRASIEHALGRGSATDAGRKSSTSVVASPAPVKPAQKSDAAPRAAAAAAGAGGSEATSSNAGFASVADAPEFEVSPAPSEWDPDPPGPHRKK
ncbi:MAG: hypothetical protein WB562_12895 [Candidatus Sulfotelmatobacter sp.]